MTRQTMFLLAAFLGVAGCAGDLADGEDPGDGDLDTAYAKPTGDSTLAVVPVTLHEDGLVHYGDQVTFEYETTYTGQTWIDLLCYQNGTLVFGGTTSFAPDYPWPWTHVMTLSSQLWTGGAADCNASLYYFSRKRRTTLATDTLAVAP